MSKLARKGGLAASIVLIVLGVGAIVVGISGRDTVRSDLAREGTDAEQALEAGDAAAGDDHVELWRVVTGHRGQHAGPDAIAYRGMGGLALRGATEVVCGARRMIERRFGAILGPVTHPNR